MAESMRQPILVVGAMAFELAGLVPPGSEQARCVATGTGPKKARDGLERSLDAGTPERIIALGLCGGLAPGETANSVAVPRNLVSVQGASEIECASWAGLASRGTLVTVNSPVSTPMEKADLRTATEADWVDMESYAWGLVARENGIPFTVVRVVVDGWDDYLPNFGSLRTWKGALSLPKRSFQARRILHDAARDALLVR